MVKIIENTSGKHTVYNVVNAVTGKFYGEYLSKQAAEDAAERIDGGRALNELLASV